tara:strand:- start:3667 stop:5007 length:1341 start_codon:yes stop_codon:yes gene_type:complete
MNETKSSVIWLQVLLAICLLDPLVVLLALPGGTMLTGGLWFWLILLMCFWMVWMMVVSSTVVATAELQPTGPRMLPPEEQPELLRQLMDVQIATEQEGVRAFRGRLKESSEAAFARLESELSDQIVPLLQQDEQFGAAILLLPKAVEQATLERPSRPWLHWLLFGLTVLTTTWAGAMHQGVNLLEEPARFMVGLPYSIGLLLILGVHELGHFFTARRHGIDVSPPFFIPVPFALGTFGAFIQMKSPTENRRSLFDVAVAGPLAGLVVAIPALLIGLLNSDVLAPNTGPSPGLLGGTSVGSSLLFALISKLAIGEQLEYGYMLRLSPLAFAGWLGLLVTALNLLPIGQLDGGHMARAMFGRRVGETISSVAMWSLFLLAIFVWPGLLLWAIIVFFIAGRSTPPLNDLTPITPARRWVGYATFLILALILIPLPHAFWDAAGIYCPYL